MAKKIIKFSPKGVTEKAVGSGPIDSFSIKISNNTSPYTVGDDPLDKFNTIQQAIDQWNSDGQRKTPILIREKANSEPYEEDLTIPEIINAFAPLKLVGVSDYKDQLGFLELPVKIAGRIKSKEGATKFAIYLENLNIEYIEDSVIDLNNNTLTNVSVTARNSVLFAITTFIDLDNSAEASFVNFDLDNCFSRTILSGSKDSLITARVNNSQIGSVVQSVDFLNVDLDTRYCDLRVSNSDFKGLLKIKNSNSGIAGPIKFLGCEINPAPLSNLEAVFDIDKHNIEIHGCILDIEGNDNSNSIIKANENCSMTDCALDLRTFDGGGNIVDSDDNIIFTYTISRGILGMDTLSTGANVTPIQAEVTLS